MKTMFFWSVGGWVAGFVSLIALFNMLPIKGGPDAGGILILSLMGSLGTAAIGALFAAVSVLQAELRETRRELKHWQVLQQLEMDLDKPSTHFKPAPPLGRS